MAALLSRALRRGFSGRCLIIALSAEGRQLGAGHGVAATSALRQLHAGAARRGGHQGDVLTSGKGPTSQPPDDPQEFNRFADLYLGDLWNKIESGLGKVEGEAFDYNVEMEGGKMRVRLPNSAEICIRKDPDQGALVVHSNLHDFYGSYDAGNEVAFKLEDGGFEAGGEALHHYIEDGLAKHLKIQVDLEPELDKIYGPDPT